MASLSDCLNSLKGTEFEFSEKEIAFYTERAKRMFPDVDADQAFINALPDFETELFEDLDNIKKILGLKPVEQSDVFNEDGSVAYDFDDTLYDNASGELTDLGNKVKERIDAGEDITIISARENTPDNRKEISDQLGISEDNIELVGSENQNDLKKQALDRRGIDRNQFYDVDKNKRDAIIGTTQPVQQTSNREQDRLIVRQQTMDQEIDFDSGGRTIEDVPITEKFRHAPNGVSEKVAQNQVDLSELEKLKGGSDRSAYNLGDGRVLKVAKNPKGLMQNDGLNFGDLQILGNIVPEIFEKGLDYIVTEFIPRSDKAVRKFLKPLEKFTQQDFDNRTSELQDVLAEMGLEDVLNYEVLFNDLKAARNWGQREDGSFAIIDEGVFSPEANASLKNKDVDPVYKKDWENIKSQRRQAAKDRSNRIKQKETQQEQTTVEQEPITEENVLRKMRDAFELQDSTAERTVSDKGQWGQAGVWRYKVENAGDILRELLIRGKRPDPSYIGEKVTALKNWINKNKGREFTPIPENITREEAESSRLGITDATDSRAWLDKFHSDTIDKIRKEYEAIPTYTKEQEIAKQLVLDLLDNNIEGVESKLGEMDKVIDYLGENRELPLNLKETQQEQNETQRRRETTDRGESTSQVPPQTKETKEQKQDQTQESQEEGGLERATALINRRQDITKEINDKRKRVKELQGKKDEASKAESLKLRRQIRQLLDEDAELQTEINRERSKSIQDAKRKIQRRTARSDGGAGGEPQITDQILQQDQDGFKTGDENQGSYNVPDETGGLEGKEGVTTKESELFKSIKKEGRGLSEESAAAITQEEFNVLSIKNDVTIAEADAFIAKHGQFAAERAILSKSNNMNDAVRASIGMRLVKLWSDLADRVRTGKTNPPPINLDELNTTRRETLPLDVYDSYKETGKVSEETIYNLAEKVRTDEGMSPREMEILNDPNIKPAVEKQQGLAMAYERSRSIFEDLLVFANDKGRALQMFRTLRSMGVEGYVYYAHRLGDKIRGNVFTRFKSIINGILVANKESVDRAAQEAAAKAAKGLGVDQKDVIAIIKNTIGGNLAQALQDGLNISKSEAERAAKRLTKAFDKAYEAEFFKRVKRSVPSKMKAFRDITTEVAGDKNITQQEILDKIIEKLGINTRLTGPQIADLRNKLGAMRNIPPTSPQLMDQAAMEAVEEINKAYGELAKEFLPKKGRDSLGWGLYYSAMLSGPGTHVINFGSNAFKVITDNLALSLVEFARNPKNPDRFYQSVSNWFGLWNGIIHGAREAREISVEGRKKTDRASKFWDSSSVEFWGRQWKSFNEIKAELEKNGLDGGALTKRARANNIKNTAAYFAKFIPRWMNSVDTMFYWSNYFGRQKQLMTELAINQGFTGKALVKEVNRRMAGGDLALSAAEFQALNEMTVYDFKTNKRVFKSKGGPDAEFFTQSDVDSRVKELLKSDSELSTQAAKLQALNELKPKNEQGVREFLTRVSGEKFSETDIRRRVDEIVQQSIENNYGLEFTREADRFAKNATYQQEPQGVMGTLAKSINRAHGSESAAVAFFSRLTVPFTRIVANVINDQLDYIAPIGLARGYDLRIPFLTSKISSSSDLTLLERDISKTKGYVGFVLSVALWAASQTFDPDLEEEDSIKIHGPGPRDFNKVIQLKAENWQPHSIQIGNNYISYRELPVGVILTILGASFDARRYENKSPDEATRIAIPAIEALASLPEIILDASFLSGLSKMFETLVNTRELSSDKAFERWQKWAIDQPRAVLAPNLFRQIAKATDPTWYQVKDNYQYFYRQHALPYIQLGDAIPGVDLSKQKAKLHPYYTALGDPVTMGREGTLPGLARGLGFSRLINVKKEDEPLYDLLNSKNVYINGLGYNTRVDGKQLWGEDRELFIKLNKERGRIIKQYLTDNYDRLSQMKGSEIQKELNDTLLKSSKKYSALKIAKRNLALEPALKEKKSTSRTRSTKRSRSRTRSKTRGK